MKSSIDTQLFDYLKSNATLLTPSRRLGARIRQEANHHFGKSKRTWVTPSIFALEDWLHALWEQFEIQGHIQSQLLSKTQSLLRWEAIIRDSRQGNILCPYEAAKTAFEAWSILHLWLAVDLLKEPKDNIDQATFCEWANTYNAWLDAQGSLDSAQLGYKLIDLILTMPNNAVELVSQLKTLILYGFEEMAPFYVQFFQQLKAHGWEVLSFEPPIQKADKITRRAYMNKEQEGQAAALWALDALRQKSKSIAVVVPQLADERHNLETLFTNTLEPLAVLKGTKVVSKFFNISAAIPLVHYPIVHAALTFLKLGQFNEPLTTHHYFLKVRSPFSAFSESERFERAQYILVLKEIVHDHWSIKDHIDLLMRMEKNKPVHWEKMLTSLVHYAQRMPKIAKFCVWARHFQGILACMGWPGERPLNSIEYQIVKRWNELLHEFGLCDAVLGPCHFNQALSTLHKLAANLPFQPENKRAPIQILGLLEAVGQNFDHLWVMGLHSDAWPPVAKPNPFIPIDYQRSQNMPHSSAEREMDYAQKVTERLKRSAAEVIMSYATQDQERSQEVSALIRDLPLDISYKMNGSVGQYRCEAYFDTPVQLEQVHDEKAPQLTKEENIIGDSSTLALQAVCPFKAFAHIRLHAKKIGSPGLWLQPKQQGIIVHAILQDFWSQYQSQQALKQLSAEKLVALFGTLIETKLQKFIPHLPYLPAPYIEVEKKRLLRVLCRYRDLELERPPFTIWAIETQKNIMLEGMEFRLRFDRIDAQENGEKIIIDYKTGKFALSDLWGERPKSLQLPLYYLAAQALAPQALFVVKLNTQECQFEGISQKEMNILGIKPLEKLRDQDIPKDWDALNEYWLSRLQPIAKAFINGEAQVDPQGGIKTCQYCDFASLCRIQERLG